MGLGKEKALPSETSMQRSTQEIARAERLGWIIDQLLLAAVAKGQVFMPERLRANAEDLVDIPQEALAVAFTRARREFRRSGALRWPMKGRHLMQKCVHHGI